MSMRDCIKEVDFGGDVEVGASNRHAVPNFVTWKTGSAAVAEGMPRGWLGVSCSCYWGCPRAG